MLCKISLVLFEDELAICGWWCTERRDREFMQNIEETGGAEMSLVVVNEEGLQSISL